MKIVSWNVNGLRSVYNKGLFEPWLAENNFDIINLQETKLQPDQMPMFLQVVPGYELHVNSAEKKGYSGVLTYTKLRPEKVAIKVGYCRFDTEGRMVRLDYKDFTLFNFYIPNGGRSKENLGYKLEFYDFLLSELAELKDKNVILVGDFNIAHTALDLARSKENENNIMFTPEERAQLDSLVDLGFVDTFREAHKDGGHYSWWAYFANARERNIGWRIDYVFVSKPLRSKVKDAFILKDVLGSDHCPVGVDIAV